MVLIIDVEIQTFLWNEKFRGDKFWKSIASVILPTIFHVFKKSENFGMTQMKWAFHDIWRYDYEKSSEAVSYRSVPRLKSLWSKKLRNHELDQDK